MVKALRATLAACLLVVLGASASEATVVRLGSTTLAIAGVTRGTSVGYDSTSQVYLVVAGGGALRGQFVDRNGGILGAPFLIQGNPALFAHFSNVTFSPDADGGAGAFLVVWHQSDLPGANTSIHARVVSYTKGGAIGADNQVSVEGSFWERYPGVAYSNTSHEFLITYPRLVRGISGVRVDLNGAALTAPFPISYAGQYEEWSSVAYSPTNNRFIVVYNGWSDAGSFGFTDVRAVQAGTNSVVAGPVRLFAGGGNNINGIAYNSVTNQFQVVWYRNAGAGGINTLGQIINPDLTPQGGVIPVSTAWRAYDGLGVAYNAVTQTSFMVSHSAVLAEDGGVEIRADGNPVDSVGVQVTVSPPKTGGNFYPRIAAGTADPNWLTVMARDFTSAQMQLLAGTPAGPPPPPPANPQIGINGPLGGPVRLPFQVVGWALDLGGDANIVGTGSDTIHIWAWPLAGGAPIFLGNPTPSIFRPDVGATFGSRFNNTGFSQTVNSLPGGDYLLAIYMHSTVTNTFNALRTVTINVGYPIMSVDTPGAGATVSAQGFFLGGWAIDMSAANGSGVDAIHVWAWPDTGAPPIFAGVGTLGIGRPDIGAIFGPQFATAGYQMVISNLPPGGYTLAVASHSSVTQTFNNMKVLHVVVQ